MSAQRIILLDSTVITSNAQTPKFETNTITELAVAVDVTVKAGTTPTLSVWLQGSPDGGTTFYDIPADLVLLDANTAAADQTAGTGKRNIITLSDTIGRAIAIYKHLPWDLIIGKWIVGGTTPSFTFSIKAVGK